METDNNGNQCVCIHPVTGDGVFNIIADNVKQIIQDENSLLIWFHEVTEEGDPWDMEFIFEDEEDALSSKKILERNIRLSKMSIIK